MLLIKNGRVIDPYTKRDGNYDILIDGERILKISENITLEDNTVVLDAKGCIVSPGLIDIHVHFRDPGFIYKEDIFSGAEAAAKGGFTTVICMANTKPVVDNQNTLKYILDKAKRAKIRVLQVATITKGMEGKELTDMRGLKTAGAVGFSDDGKPIMNAKIAFEAMKIAKELNVPLSFHEEDPTLIYENGINMGEVAKTFNVLGSPHEAEDVMVARDAILAMSTGAKINIQHISSKTSIEIIKWARDRGADIVAEVTPHHFSLTQEALLEKGSNAKMNPPLRLIEDKEAILEAFQDNIIDIIATDHAPHAKSEKDGPIQIVPSGIIGLETSLALSVTNLVKKGHLNLMEMLEKMTINPAKLYGLDLGKIEEGAVADITIFNINEEFTVGNFISKSFNSPFSGAKLYGKVKNTIYKGEVIYADGN